MPSQEQHLALAAYRPDGQDADDPAIRAALDALDATGADPALRSQFENQLEFDRAVADAFASIPVPATLRDDIIAGARLATPAAATLRSTLRPWLAAAATVAVLATGATLVFRSLNPPATPPARPLAGSTTAPWLQESVATLDQLLDVKGHTTLLGAGPAQSGQWLVTHVGADLTLPPLLRGRPTRMCKRVERPDGSIAVICFDTGDGTTLHLTVFDGDDPDSPLPTSPKDSPVHDNGTWQYVAWRDDHHRYMLAAAATSKPCCQRLRQIAQL